MEKEFIPYEQALALKELGFDEPCFAKYFQQDGNTPFIQIGESEIEEAESADDDVTFECDAPLYQQAFRWLLELANKDKLFSNKWTISYNEDYYSLFLGGCNMGVFESELECLKKLIEIVKEK
jgi:hypothetical protein